VPPVCVVGSFSEPIGCVLPEGAVCPRSVTRETPAGMRACDCGEILLAPTALLGVPDVPEDQDPDAHRRDDDGDEEDRLDSGHVAVVPASPEPLTLPAR
jgi:hypothetical protein